MTVTEDDSTETEPQSFDGVLGIKWPASPVATDRSLLGWQVSPFDADGPVNTILEFTLHAKATGLIWIEATMFADDAGKPVLHTRPPGYQLLVEDGKPVTGTFRFLVIEMRVQSADAQPQSAAAAGTGSL